MRTSRLAAVSRAKVLTQEMPQPCKPLYSSYAQEGMFHYSLGLTDFCLRQTNWIVIAC